jgi:APA family basic amino acid/polyamine antiporter
LGQAVWSCLLCLTGTYQALYEYVVFALVIFFSATGFAVIVLRRKLPEKRRPYKAWGYPAVPLLFVLINIAIFFNTVVAQTIKSLIGLGILGLGIPAYLYWKNKSSKESQNGKKN